MKKYLLLSFLIGVAWGKKDLGVDNIEIISKPFQKVEVEKDMNHRPKTLLNTNTYIYNAGKQLEEFGYYYGASLLLTTGVSIIDIEDENLRLALLLGSSICQIVAAIKGVYAGRDLKEASNQVKKFIISSQ